MDNQNQNQSKPAMQTPLALIEAINLAETRLFELPLCGKITLRGDSANKAFGAAIKKITGLGLPLKANTFKQKDQHVLAWTGPNEWMLHCPLDDCLTLINDLRAELGTQHAAVVDVSDYYTVLELSGPLAKQVLASGSPFDTHPSQFATGHCAQTRYGHASILIAQMSDLPSYHIQIRWSYADYLFRFMSDALQNHASEDLPTM